MEVVEWVAFLAHGVWTRETKQESGSLHRNLLQDQLAFHLARYPSLKTLNVSLYQLYLEHQSSLVLEQDLILAMLRPLGLRPFD